MPTGASLRTTSALDYVVTVPQTEPPPDGYPLIVFLHGLAERGAEPAAVIDHPGGTGRGLAAFALTDPDFPFVTVSPLCPRGRFWPLLGGKLDRTLDAVLVDHPIDPERVYLTGVSMGGMGVWAWALRSPDRFAAVAPIAGGIYRPWMRADVERLRSTPVAAFHDARDPEIPIGKTSRWIDHIAALGGDATLEVTTTGRHLIHEPVFEEGALFDWFLSHR